jgi:hypothetical protein
MSEQGRGEPIIIDDRPTQRPPIALPSLVATQRLLGDLLGCPVALKAVAKSLSRDQRLGDARGRRHV